ncbi:hypothetical protein LCGC14_2791460, partial [marine sediment metagenome]
QEERAAVSTTEWYQKQVSPTLFGNMWYQLLGPGNKWPPSAQVWNRKYTGSYGWWREHNWSDLKSYRMLTDKLRSLKAIADSTPTDAESAGKAVGTVRYLYDGRYSNTYPKPSWRDTIYGATGGTCTTHGILEEFHPHRRDKLKPVTDRLDGLWKEALAATEQLRQKSEANAPAAEIRAAFVPLATALKQIVAEAKPLTQLNERDHRAVNWAIRLDILTGPERDKVYDWWVAEVLSGLTPLVRDFARGQFKKGIIVHKDGVDKAMAEFPKTVVPLLRRDIEKMLNRRKFYDRIHATVYPFKGYASKVTGKGRLPTRKDAEAELAIAGKILARWPEADRAYATERRKLLAEQFRGAVGRTKEALLDMVLTGNLLFREMGSFIEGVDYADKVQEKLDARAMALKGRGQDLAKLTA